MVVTCPDRAVLESFLAGTLPEASVGPLMDHIETCRSCQSSLDTLTGSASDTRTLPQPEIDTPSAFLDQLKRLDPFSADRTDLADDPFPVIAGFELLAELGRGGVGVVYKATQLALHRTVALKVLRAADRATREDLDRFATEARAIGQLNDAGIVQVFEVGTAGDRPYVVLEYVEGGNLDRLINGAPQRPPAAAACVAKLARAIDAAHRVGVVHRDLKPANVLLADGNLDRPKIADFGLAKRLDLGSGHTHTGMILGTPSYMAPEQARGDIRAIDRRTDVYGLGAILYELLTGRPPFRGPTPLDTVVQVASNDPLPPRQSQPGVPRDLETVCLKCLEKNPGRRYDNALELAADLDRFLAGRPTLARPVGLVGRAAKLARRHPLSAGLLALLALVVIGSVVGLSILYVRAVAARDQFEEERKIAVAETKRADEALVETKKFAAEAEKAAAEAKKSAAEAGKAVAGLRAVNSFFQRHILAAPRPGGAGPGVTVREAIRAAEKRLHGEFADQPETEAAIRETLSKSHYQFGDYVAAREQAARVLALRRSLFPAASEEVYTAQNNLALADLQLGRFAEAEEMLRATLRGREVLHGDAHPSTLSSRNSLAGYLLSTGRLHEAEEQFTKTIELRRQDPQTPPAELLAVRNNLGGVFLEQERYDEAVVLLRDVLAGRQKLDPPNPAEVFASRANLAIALRHVGRLDEAEALVTAAAATVQANFGENSPQVLEVECLRAANLLARGKAGEAVATLTAAFAVGPGRLPREHPLRQRYLLNACAQLIDRRHFAAALPHLEDLLTVRRATLSADNLLLGGTLPLHAECLMEAGRSADAEKELREALAIREKALPAGHWRIATLRSFLGECLTRQRRYRDALPLLRTSYDDLQKSKDTTPSARADAARRLADLYTALGQPDEAAKWKGK